jgi:hypothetical protein
MLIFIEAIFGAFLGSIALAIPLFIVYAVLAFNGIASPEQLLGSMLFGPYGLVAVLYFGALGGIILCRHIRAIEDA